MSHFFQPSGLPGRMADGWRQHWPHYVAEAVGLAYFVSCASVVVILLEHPISPVRQAIGSAVLRRAVQGVVMGLVIVSITYSPWGKRSGAHINPAITLAFWRLGRISGVDSLWYVMAQAGLSYKNGQVAVSPTFVVATLQNHDYYCLPA